MAYITSENGKQLRFQIGKAKQEGGVGFGLIIMNLEETARNLEDF